MRIVHSKNRKSELTQDHSTDSFGHVSQRALREVVERIAFPRHYLAERRANLRARDLLADFLRDMGYAPTLQGEYDNIMVQTESDGRPWLLLGAHYDSVPGTPGADDNGSAVAACLECARLVQEYQIASTMIVFFNREEDGLLGSKDFVESLKWDIEEAHIFEMVGFCSHAPDSQRMPPGVPGFLGPKVGDFLGLLSNRKSNAIAERLLTLASSYVRDLPTLALKMYLGLERVLGHLNRSDHAPFWKAGIPAIMWTDTAEFRNANYHQASDTPETLDYEFLMRVTQLAMTRALLRGAS